MSKTLSTSDLLNKFNITRVYFDSVVRRKKSEWGLRKDSEGRFIWDAQAIDKFKAYLEVQETKKAKRLEAELMDLRQKHQKYPIPYIHEPLEQAVRNIIYEYTARQSEIIVMIKEGSVKLEATWEHK